MFSPRRPASPQLSPIMTAEWGPGSSSFLVRGHLFRRDLHGRLQFTPPGSDFLWFSATALSHWTEEAADPTRSSLVFTPSNLRFVSPPSYSVNGPRPIPQFILGLDPHDDFPLGAVSYMALSHDLMRLHLPRWAESNSVPASSFRGEVFSDPVLEALGNPNFPKYVPVSDSPAPSLVFPSQGLDLFPEDRELVTPLMQVIPSTTGIFGAADPVAILWRNHLGFTPMEYGPDRLLQKKAFRWELSPVDLSLQLPNDGQLEDFRFRARFLLGRSGFFHLFHLLVSWNLVPNPQYAYLYSRWFFKSLTFTFYPHPNSVLSTLSMAGSHGVDAVRSAPPRLYTTSGGFGPRTCGFSVSRVVRRLIVPFNTVATLKLFEITAARRLYLRSSFLDFQRSLDRILLLLVRLQHFQLGKLSFRRSIFSSSAAPSSPIKIYSHLISHFSGLFFFFPLNATAPGFPARGPLSQSPRSRFDRLYAELQYGGLPLLSGYFINSGGGSYPLRFGHSLLNHFPPSQFRLYLRRLAPLSHYIFSNSLGHRFSDPYSVGGVSLAEPGVESKPGPVFQTHDQFSVFDKFHPSLKTRVWELHDRSIRKFAVLPNSGLVSPLSTTAWLRRHFWATEPEGIQPGRSPVPAYPLPSQYPEIDVSFNPLGRSVMVNNWVGELSNALTQLVPGLERPRKMLGSLFAGRSFYVSSLLIRSPLFFTSASVIAPTPLREFPPEIKLSPDDLAPPSTAITESGSSAGRNRTSTRLSLFTRLLNFLNSLLSLGRLPRVPVMSLRIPSLLGQFTAPSTHFLNYLSPAIFCVWLLFFSLNLLPLLHQLFTAPHHLSFDSEWFLLFLAHICPLFFLPAPHDLSLPLLPFCLGIYVSVNHSSVYVNFYGENAQPTLDRFHSGDVFLEGSSFEEFLDYFPVFTPLVLPLTSLFEFYLDYVNISPHNNWEFWSYILFRSGNLLHNTSATLFLDYLSFLLLLPAIVALYFFLKSLQFFFSFALPLLCFALFGLIFLSVVWFFLRFSACISNLLADIIFSVVDALFLGRSRLESSVASHCTDLLSQRHRQIRIIEIKKFYELYLSPQTKSSFQNGFYRSADESPVSTRLESLVRFTLAASSGFEFSGDVLKLLYTPNRPTSEFQKFDAIIPVPPKPPFMYGEYFPPLSRHNFVSPRITPQSVEGVQSNFFDSHRPYPDPNPRPNSLLNLTPPLTLSPLSFRVSDAVLETAVLHLADSRRFSSVSLDFALVQIFLARSLEMSRDSHYAGFSNPIPPDGLSCVWSFHPSNATSAPWFESKSYGIDDDFSTDTLFLNRTGDSSFVSFKDLIRAKAGIAPEVDPFRLVRFTPRKMATGRLSLYSRFPGNLVDLSFRPSTYFGSGAYFSFLGLLHFVFSFNYFIFDLLSRIIHREFLAASPSCIYGIFVYLSGLLLGIRHRFWELFVELGSHHRFISETYIIDRFERSLDPSYYRPLRLSLDPASDFSELEDWADAEDEDLGFVDFISVLLLPYYVLSSTLTPSSAHPFSDSLTFLRLLFHGLTGHLPDSALLSLRLSTFSVRLRRLLLSAILKYLDRFPSLLSHLTSFLSLLCSLAIPLLPPFFYFAAPHLLPIFQIPLQFLLYYFRPGILSLYFIWFTFLYFVFVPVLWPSLHRQIFGVPGSLPEDRFSFSSDLDSRLLFSEDYSLEEDRSTYRFDWLPDLTGNPEGYSSRFLDQDVTAFSQMAYDGDENLTELVSLGLSDDEFILGEDPFTAEQKFFLLNLNPYFAPFSDSDFDPTSGAAFEERRQQLMALRRRRFRLRSRFSRFWNRLSRNYSPFDSRWLSPLPSIIYFVRQNLLLLGRLYYERAEPPLSRVSFNPYRPRAPEVSVEDRLDSAGPHTRFLRSEPSHPRRTRILEVGFGEVMSNIIRDPFISFLGFERDLKVSTLIGVMQGIDPLSRRQASISSSIALGALRSASVLFPKLTENEYSKIQKVLDLQRQPDSHQFDQLSQHIRWTNREYVEEDPDLFGKEVISGRQEPLWPYLVFIFATFYQNQALYGSELEILRSPHLSAVHARLSGSEVQEFHRHSLARSVAGVHHEGFSKRYYRSRLEVPSALSRYHEKYTHDVNLYPYYPPFSAPDCRYYWNSSAPRYLRIRSHGGYIKDLHTFLTFRPYENYFNPEGIYHLSYLSRIFPPLARHGIIPKFLSAPPVNHIPRSGFIFPHRFEEISRLAEYRLRLRGFDLRGNADNAMWYTRFNFQDRTKLMFMKRPLLKFLNKLHPRLRIARTLARKREPKRFRRIFYSLHDSPTSRFSHFSVPYGGGRMLPRRKPRKKIGKPFYQSVPYFYRKNSYYYDLARSLMVPGGDRVLPINAYSGIDPVLGRVLYPASNLRPLTSALQLSGHYGPLDSFSKLRREFVPPSGPAPLDPLVPYPLHLFNPITGSASPVHREWFYRYPVKNRRRSTPLLSYNRRRLSPYLKSPTHWFIIDRVGNFPTSSQLARAGPSFYGAGLPQAYVYDTGLYVKNLYRHVFRKRRRIYTKALELELRRGWHRHNFWLSPSSEVKRGDRFDPYAFNQLSRHSFNLRKKKKKWKEESPWKHFYFTTTHLVRPYDPTYLPPRSSAPHYYTVTRSATRHVSDKNFYTPLFSYQPYYVGSSDFRWAGFKYSLYRRHLRRILKPRTLGTASVRGYGVPKRFSSSGRYHYYEPLSGLAHPGDLWVRPYRWPSLTLPRLFLRRNLFATLQSGRKLRKQKRFMGLTRRSFRPLDLFLRLSPHPSKILTGHRLATARQFRDPKLLERGQLANGFFNSARRSFNIAYDPLHSSVTDLSTSTRSTVRRRFLEDLYLVRPSQHFSLTPSRRTVLLRRFPRFRYSFFRNDFLDMSHSPGFAPFGLPRRRYRRLFGVGFRRSGRAPLKKSIFGRHTFRHRLLVSDRYEQASLFYARLRKKFLRRLMKQIRRETQKVAGGPGPYANLALFTEFRTISPKFSRPTYKPKIRGRPDNPLFRSVAYYLMIKTYRRTPPGNRARTSRRFLFKSPLFRYGRAHQSSWAYVSGNGHLRAGVDPFFLSGGLVPKFELHGPRRSLVERSSRAGRKHLASVLMVDPVSLHRPLIIRRPKFRSPRKKDPAGKVPAKKTLAQELVEAVHRPYFFRTRKKLPKDRHRQRKDKSRWRLLPDASIPEWWGTHRARKASAVSRLDRLGLTRFRGPSPLIPSHPVLTGPLLRFPLLRSLQGRWDLTTRKFFTERRDSRRRRRLKFLLSRYHAHSNEFLPPPSPRTTPLYGDQLRSLIKVTDPPTAPVHRRWYSGDCGATSPRTLRWAPHRGSEGFLRKHRVLRRPTHKRFRKRRRRVFSPDQDYVLFSGLKKKHEDDDHERLSPAYLRDRMTVQEFSSLRRNRKLRSHLHLGETSEVPSARTRRQRYTRPVFQGLLFHDDISESTTPPFLFNFYHGSLGTVWDLVFFWYLNLLDFYNLYYLSAMFFSFLLFSPLVISAAYLILVATPKLFLAFFLLLFRPFRWCFG